MKTKRLNLVDVLIDALLYFIYLLLATLAIMCVELFSIKVVSLFVELTPYALCLIRALIYAVGICAVLAFAAYKEGFKAVKVSPLSSSISFVIMAIVYFVFCLLFSFEPFCAGGVESVSILLKYGSNITAENYSAVLLRIDCIAVFLVHMAIYGIIFVSFRSVGARQRIISREGMVISDSQNEE